jgi:hypothetical protein
MPTAKDYGPSIKDPERYEALREMGYSKEKSVRISNTPRYGTSLNGGQSPPCDGWSKDDLYENAKENGH